MTQKKMVEKIELFLDCIKVDAGVVGLELSDGFNLEMVADGQENFYLRVRLPMELRHRYKLGDKHKVTIEPIEQDG